MYSERWKFNLSKHITVQWEGNTFDTKSAFLNFSGTVGVPSSGILYGNTRNAFELFLCVKHRRTSKFLRRFVKDLRIERLDVHRPTGEDCGAPNMAQM